MEAVRDSVEALGIDFLDAQVAAKRDLDHSRSIIALKE